MICQLSSPISDNDVDKDCYTECSENEIDTEERQIKYEIEQSNLEVIEKNLQPEIYLKPKHKLFSENYVPDDS